MESVYLTIPLAPLFGAILAGLFGKQIGRSGAHFVTIAGVGLAFILSLVVLKHHVIDGGEIVEWSLYQWANIAGLSFEVGFLIDSLTAIMLCVVTSVSLAVHVYTIGYMHEDDGYQRFFSYIALFTFSMLMLVMSNNFMQLFFGWEAVGLVSYLLIGFWYKKPTAIKANMKAFLVNRVGDFGFLLGIGLVLAYFGSMNYKEVFAGIDGMSGTMIAGPTGDISLFTAIALLLFVGAMGKSAQAPLHVWLPDSMEGPTPISALIHAATMVTAGVFMVARMSPIFEMSEAALSTILYIGGFTALAMGMIGLVQNDIKRVVAYSTLSQLGYMVVALGASAYAASVFHLMTHAFFKALLFLAAGSVIIGMHHEQDMRKMGGLRHKMPVTFWVSVIGTLALIGFPGFAGFFSKDMIIEAVGQSHLSGAGFAHACVLMGVFITSLYSFRLLFLTFFGEGRMDAHTASHVHESPKVVTWPLIALAIPSVIIGWITIKPMLFGDVFKDVIHVAKYGGHNVLADLERLVETPLALVLHSVATPAFWLALGGFVTAYVLYILKPELPGKLAKIFAAPRKLLEQKYFFDHVYEWVFAGGSRALGQAFWKFGDTAVIDGILVNGSAKVVGMASGIVRRVQSGLLYHYAFAMIIGLLVLIVVFVI